MSSAPSSPPPAGPSVSPAAVPAAAASSPAVSSGSPAESTAASSSAAPANAAPANAAAASPAAAPSDCGTAASLRQQGDAERSGSVAAKSLDAEKCTPTAPAGTASAATTGSATSVGLLSNTGLTNVQTGAIKAVGGTAGGTLTNTTTSTVETAGAAAAGTGDAAAGTSQGSAPASALGAATSNLISDVSNITVTVGGANEAPITATSEHVRDVHDTGLAGASTAATPKDAVTPDTSAVTGGNDTAAVTPAAAVTADPAPSEAQSASCAGNAASNKIEGKAEKKVTGAAASGEPIAITIGQQAKVTNNGTTNGSPAGAAAPAANAAPAASGNGSAAAPEAALAPTTGGSGGAGAQGLSSTNTVDNKALVDVSIKGNNYAPITIAIHTVTTIVNNAVALVQTAAGGSQPSTGESAGVGARVANDVHLDSNAVVDIAGDNHSPIKIVLDLGAELWNKGMALVGLSGGANGATADGLQVDNILSLLGSASVHIGGSNYAPIDIEVLLHNLIYNEGVAEAQSLAQTAPRAAQNVAGTAIDTARRLSSGPASCMSLLSNTAVANAQIASVRMPSTGIVGQVLAGNTHVVDVQGHGAAQCTTGNVQGVGGSSGDVVIGPASTVLTVVTSQTADTSGKTDPSKDQTPGTNPGNGTGGRPVEVVIAVTTAPVVSPGKVANKGKKIVRDEDVWEWQVQWVPLYVIYPAEPRAAAPAPVAEEAQTETTTSMAGGYTTPAAVVTPRTVAPTGLDLLTQLELALLGILAFVLLRVLKRRLAFATARKEALTAPELIVVSSGTGEAAAE